jgi:flagellar biosynthetic protein FliP
MSMRGLPKPNTLADVPTYVLIPAFVLNELTVAFKIGILLYIPFIIIDMVVASTLMSMGMIMLPPVMISMPFKLILFVLVDGWNLLTQQIVQSFM